MNIIKQIQKYLFPKTLKCVYRKDILEYALKHKHNTKGVCFALWDSLSHYGIVNNINLYLPLANLNNAKRFGAKLRNDGYWWPKGEWNTGRFDFLKWLLEQYKNDKTNLKCL